MADLESLVSFQQEHLLSSTQFSHSVAASFVVVTAAIVVNHILIVDCFMAILLTNQWPIITNIVRLEEQAARF